MQVAAIVLFWGSVAGILYAYVGYPLLLALLTRLSSRPLPATAVAASDDLRFDPAEADHNDWPEVTVLISAYNAAGYLRERVQNILQCEYPADRLHVLVASDGSSDDTVAVVEGMGLANVSVVSFRQRRGKVETLIDAMKSVRSEVVVFTDASTRFEPNALHYLVRHFRNQSVGLVAGTPVMVDSDGRPAESFYWRSEMQMRRRETQRGVMLGASGAIYALRRRLFVAPPRPVINDDLVIPTLVHLRHQCNVVLEPRARALVTSSGGIKAEFRRRVRIGSGACQSVRALRSLWRWQHRRTAIAFVSRKLLRWMCPLLMIVAFASNLALVSLGGYDLLLASQVAVYALAIAGLWMKGQGGLSRMARMASSFLCMNAALLLGLARWAYQPGSVLWTPTVRPTWQQLAARQSAALTSAAEGHVGGGGRLPGPTLQGVSNPPRSIAQPSLRRA